MPDLMVNGHEHHYEEAGAGEALVMVHAAAVSGRSFARHMEALGGRFHVLAIDLRGMGQSAHVPALPVDWVADLIALLEHLGASANLYGASLGSRIAMKAALLRPELVKRLMLDHPVIAVDAATNAALSATLTMDAIDDRRARFYQEHHGADWEAVVRQYFASRLLPEFQGYLDLREASKAIRQPTLILRGDRLDPAHPLAHAAELAGNINGAWLWIRPNSRVQALDAGGEEAYELIGRFVAETAAT